MKTRCILLSCLLLGACSLSRAQTVDELCRGHVEALGGEAVSHVKTLKITQQGASQGVSMPMTTILLPGEAYYQKVRTPMGTMVTCAYRDKGWTYASQPQPRTTPLTEAMVKSMLIQSKFYGPLYDYYVNGDRSDVRSITKKGVENIDREECQHLEVTYKSGYKASVYLSTRDHMIRKAVTPAGTVKYGDYKKAAGVMIPRYVEMVNGQGDITATVSKVSVNEKVDDALFAHP